MEAYYIAQALCSYIMMISPERIVLGGGVMHQEQMLPLVRKEVRRQLRGYIQGKGLDSLDEYIVPVSLGDDQGVMGAIKLAMDAYAERGSRPYPIDGSNGTDGAGAYSQRPNIGKNFGGGKTR
jgi:predicted NBD/HSP70 family sugar kinase